MESYKFRLSEELFSNGEYNYELFKYAIEKVLESEKKEKEERGRNNPEIKMKKLVKEEKNTQKTIEANKRNILSLYFSFLILIFSMLLIGFHYFLYSSYPNYFNCNKI